jgi:hypothetical protein
VFSKAYSWNITVLVSLKGNSDNMKRTTFVVVVSDVVIMSRYLIFAVQAGVY